MWRSILVGLVVILLCMSTTTSQAQMYWGSGSSSDETVSPGVGGTDSQVRRPAQTRGSFRMYDYADAPEPEAEAVPQASAAPARPRAEGPVRQDDTSRQRTDTPLRSPERTPATTNVTSPRPAVTTPGGSQVAPESERTPGAIDKIESKRLDNTGSGPTEQPVTRKMKWGQGDPGQAESAGKPPASQ